MRLYYLTQLVGSGSHENPWRGKFTDEAPVASTMRLAREGKALCCVDIDVGLAAGLQAEIQGDPDSFLIAHEPLLDMLPGSATWVGNLQAELEKFHVPADWIHLGRSHREILHLLSTLAMFPQRFEHVIGTAVHRRARSQGDLLDTTWDKLKPSSRAEFVGAWESALHRHGKRPEFTPDWRLRDMLKLASRQYMKFPMYLGNEAISTYPGNRRPVMAAYGDSHYVKGTDAFTNSPWDGNWTNSWSVLAGLVWVTGGYVSHSSANAAARNDAVTLRDDHYAKVVNQQQQSSSMAACVRMATGTSQACYRCYNQADSSARWAIYEYNASAGFSTVATNATGYTALSAGDVVTGEAEGTTIRQGDDSTGTDGQHVSGTDATLTSGYAGMALYRSTPNNAQITSWEAGDLNVADLTATDVESASEVSTPAVGQVHGLSATSIESASEVSTPAVGQVHGLTPTDTESASEVSTPAIGQVHALTATDVESTSELSTPTLSTGGSHDLTATDVESASEVSTPAVGQIHALTATDTESTSEVTTPAIGQVHALTATGAESTSELTTPALGQVHALTPTDVESASQLSTPALNGSTNLRQISLSGTFNTGIALTGTFATGNSLTGESNT